MTSYLTEHLAPAASSCFLASSASSLVAPCLRGLGRPSMRSLASLRPRLVRDRMALITAMRWAVGTSSIMTSNSVCSSTAGAASATAAAAPGAAEAAAGAKAAAVTPSSVWSQSTRFRASSRVRDFISLPNFSSFAVSTAALTARDEADFALGRTSLHAQGRAEEGAPRQGRRSR